MSHAANIRNRHNTSQNQESSSKRRRTDGPDHQVNGFTPKTNGVLPHAHLTANPTKDVKSSGRHDHAESSAVVRHPDAEQDVEMADSGSDVSSDSEGEDEDDDEESNGPEGEDESDEDDESEASDNAEDEELAKGPMHMKRHHQNSSKGMVNGEANEDQAVAGAAAEGERDAPSFGEILKARGQEPIDVNALHSLSDPAPKSVTEPTNNRVLSVPSANSLGTVLTQALRTNDVDLLESCLQVPNLQSIRATIERLHSSHATTLLQKLAERLHKRPGRAGSLMVWVQWTIVAHGGYLASQPGAMRELHTLHQVVKQRATGLQPLLALKGKLDLLEAQMQLRRNMQDRSRARHHGTDAGVTYVEGQEESSSDEEEALPTMMPTSTISTKPRSRRYRSKRKAQPSIPAKPMSQDEAEDEDIEGDMPTTLPNAVGGEFEDFGEDDEGSSDEEDDLLDDEAEETDEDSEAFSEEIDYDDVDEADESEEDERPAKRSKA